MGSHTPVVYTTDQFKWHKRTQAFYASIKMLTAFRHGNKRFKRKKKFIIVNPKTNVSVEFISDREYTRAYRFRSRSKPAYYCYVFKPGFNPDDKYDISPVSFIKIYPADEHKKYHVYYNGDMEKIYIDYNFLGRGTPGTKSTMNEIYKKIGVKRTLTISIQDCLDEGFCMDGIIRYLSNFTSCKFPYLKQLKAWRKKCPTFILQYKVTFDIYNDKWDVYNKFKHKTIFCPIEKLILKKV